MVKAHSARVLFVTGTDTGVGKTVVTALLLAHLRAQGRNALALKPFCSGGRQDALLLDELQDHAIPLRVVNPFSFDAPLSPLAAARLEDKPVNLQEVTRSVRRVGLQCETVLVEGAGGLLVPLTRKATVLDLIRFLRAEVLVVAANKLGTINHTLLTVGALEQAGLRRIKVVLVDTLQADASASSNAEILTGKLGRMPLIQIPYLGRDCSQPINIRRAARKLGKKLAVLAK